VSYGYVSKYIRGPRQTNDYHPVIVVAIECRDLQWGEEGIKNAKKAERNGVNVQAMSRVFLISVLHTVVRSVLSWGYVGITSNATARVTT